MTRIPLTALLISAMALPAFAGQPDFTSRIGRHRENRIFWLSDTQAFPNRALAGAADSTSIDDTAKPAAQQFTKTYVEGIARRFGPTSGHLDMFTSRLGAAGPAFSGTVDGGTAKLVLRWHPDEQ